MAWISSKDLMGNDVNVEASYKDLLHCRKMRQTYAIEAALELRKCFNSAQNYIKMLDLLIDEIEKDPEFKLTNQQQADDPKNIFEDHFAFARNKKQLNEYTQFVL